jgi:hypothetical protein
MRTRRMRICTVMTNSKYGVYEKRYYEQQIPTDDPNPDSASRRIVA